MGKIVKLFTSLLAVLCMLLFAFCLTANADELITDGDALITDGDVLITDGDVSDDDKITDGDVTPDPVFAMGDLNADGKVGADEARTVLRAAVGLDRIDAAVIAYADVDHNGVLTANDARDVLRVAAGLDEKVTHSFRNDAVSASTCTLAGNVSYSCTCCDLSGEIELPLEAHDYEVADHLDPTCTEKGYDKQVCSVCENEKETSISALGHKYEETERTEPTCTEQGLSKSVCSVCSDVKEEKLKSKGHSYKETANKAATCTEKGLLEYTCSVCSSVLSMPSNALGHEMVRCTATVPQHCSRCNEKYTGVQQAATGLYYYYTKSGNNYTCAKNQIVGSSYYGPDGARVDDAAIEAAVEFVNTYTSSSDSAYNRLSDCYYILVDYFGYKNNPDVTTTPDGRHIPGYCTQMLDEWSGNCYRFAAAFAYMARVLGYDVGFITGQISASGGGTTTHGLTEIYYGGTTYWCDAMMQNKYPSTNSFFVTSSTYPYGYTRNYRIRMYVSDGKVTWS